MIHLLYPIVFKDGIRVSDSVLRLYKDLSILIAAILFGKTMKKI